MIFSNIYSKLPSAFYTKMSAEGFAKQPTLIAFNKKVAQLIELNHSDYPKLADYLAGNKNFIGSDPLAMVYAGHQFGVWVPQLGDGRALLIGQIKNKHNKRFDIQLKGSGITPYSRFADGRAVLRSTIREYLCAEMMAGLGIPTSRSLAIIKTGDKVRRESWEDGAILTRITTSHIRFGHIEFFCHNKQENYVKILLDHIIQNYLPQYKNVKQPYHDLLSWVVDKTATLIAQWQVVGFCHGVMNTDNMSILAETIDYGPFGFLEEYNPRHICNHSDDMGRYSFQNQPSIAWWNLYALAVAMKSQIDQKDAEAIVKPFITKFEDNFYHLMAKKLGLITTKKKCNASRQLILDWLTILENNKADYHLSHLLLNENITMLYKNNLFDHDAGKIFLKKYQAMLGDTPDNLRHTNMKKINPTFILRNWVAQVAIEEAEKENYQPLNDILQLCQDPFVVNEKQKKFSTSTPAKYQNLSISCSS
ncbi:MAG: protein adenylyltransferase SelO [Alphaproteobacteria bacterium]